ncbi:MAG: ATPase, partial [Firmicutes bacterium]|nr:ATPase [Bacillota bacterium]
MWFSKSQNEVLVDSSVGLSESEAKARLDKYGLNKLKGKPKKSILTLFLSQLKDMLIYVLLAATIITLIIGEIADSVIILLVIILNAVIGV